MKKFVCLTMAVALCICGTVAAEEAPRILTYDGQVQELTASIVTATLGDVLGAYGVALDEPDSINPLLRELLRETVSDPAEVYALEVSWVGAEPPLDPMLEPLSVTVVAAIGSDTALVDLHVSSGSLHADVTRFAPDGESTSLKVEHEILKPTTVADPSAVLDTVGDAQPLQAYYLALVALDSCTCDDGLGTKGCKSGDCDVMNTCPGGPNGRACGWIVVVGTVATKPKLTKVSGAVLRPDAPASMPIIDP